jgi:hypothetical protein
MQKVTRQNMKEIPFSEKSVHIRNTRSYPQKMGTLNFNGWRKTPYTMRNMNEQRSCNEIQTLMLVLE